MSAALEPGMWVECVTPYDAGGGVAVRLGHVYFVERVFEPPPGCTCRVHGGACRGPALALRDIAPRALGGWCSRQFRPIDRRTTELFRSLLVPAPERALEDA